MRNLFIKFIGLIIFSLWRMQSVVGSADGLLENQDIYSSSVTKVNDYFYLRKEKGYFFVMERIDHGNKETRFETWYNVTDRCKLNKSLDPGRLGFQSSFKAYEKIHKNGDSIPMFWVAYAVPGTDLQEVLPDIMNIRMYMSALTTPDSLFAVHIGIQKTTEELETPKLPKNISILFHSFVAQTLQRVNPNIIYMVTRPTPIMTKIFKKSFGENVWLSYQENVREQGNLEQDPSNPLEFDYTQRLLRLYDQNRTRIIFEVNGLKKSASLYEKPVDYSNYRWFVVHPDLWSDSCPFAVIDYQLLASMYS